MLDFVYCPISELPYDADPTRAGKYSFGSDVFGGSGDWIIVENGTEPTKVYKVPLPIGRCLTFLFDTRFEMGRADAQAAIRTALGLTST